MARRLFGRGQARANVQSLGAEEFDSRAWRIHGGGVKPRRSVIWALSLALFVGWSMPGSRANVPAVASVGALVATAEVGADVDHAPAVSETGAVSVCAKAPARSVHVVVASRHVDGGPTWAPLARAESAGLPVAPVPLYALYRVYRI